MGCCNHATVWSACQLVGIGAAFFAQGCKGCEDDRPYTPFGVASAVDAALPAPSAHPSSAHPEEPDRFEPTAATAAPDQANQWELGEVSMTAPEGQVFELGLAADFNQDGQSEAVAWTVPAGSAEKPRPGQLWVFSPTGRPRRLTDLPGFVPTGPGCKTRTTLSRTGPQTVTLSAAADCETRRIERSPVRALLVVAPTAARPSLVQVRIADAAQGEVIDAAVDSTDRDGDGRDDVKLSLSVSASGSQRPATARLLWLDRAAGPSREPHEPRSSLERAASNEVVRAGGKNTSATVEDGVGSIRRLIASLCREAATVRIYDADGGAFDCGSLQLTADRLVEAEVRASLTRKNVPAALAALARDGWYSPRASSKAREKLEALIAKATLSVSPERVTWLRVRATSQPQPPRWSPLQFEQPEASLLVQTTAGLTRVAADGGTETPVEPDSGIAAWPLAVTMPDNSRLTGIAHACNRSELMLVFTAPRFTQPTRLLAARPGPCAAGAPPESGFPAPVELREGKLVALLGGAIVGLANDSEGFGSGSSIRGSPRSPDGRHWVTPTPMGLLVMGNDTPELWDAAGLGAWHEITDCTVANGASAVACVALGRIVLLRRLGEAGVTSTQ